MFAVKHSYFCICENGLYLVFVSKKCSFIDKYHSNIGRLLPAKYFANSAQG